MVFSIRKYFIDQRKVESQGIPLKSWDIVINYGIKTGLNEAFVIDKATRERLIQEDPKSESIIKPMVRGRDIQKYRLEFEDLYLIGSHNGFDKTAAIDINEYHVIKNILINLNLVCQKDMIKEELHIT